MDLRFFVDRTQGSIILQPYFSLLLEMGDINATSAYAKVGLYPFNPLADSWENAIDTLGLENALDMQRVKTKKIEIKVITSEEGRPSLSQEEEDTILTG